MVLDPSIATAPNPSRLVTNPDQITELEDLRQQNAGELSKAKSALDVERQRTVKAAGDANAVQDRLEDVQRQLSEARRKTSKAESAAARAREERDVAACKHERIDAQLREFRRAGGGGEAALVRKLNADLMKRLNCSVCGRRERDTIITRCWHAFCGECVSKQIETRSRKCPSCNKKFSDGDVHRFYAAT